MKRQRIPELMDDPAVDPTAHAHAIRSLNRVNRLLGFDRRIYHSVHQFHGRSTTLLDIACGGGGFLDYLTQQNAGIRCFGLDRSEFALQSARRLQAQPSTAYWLSADARGLPFADASIDVVTCSLFLHHFEPSDVVIILREAVRVARRAIVVVDLARSWLAWCLTWLVTRMLSRSRIFHIDGPRSVCAAFTASELAAMAQCAGLSDATVRRQFPFRLLLIYGKTESMWAQPSCGLR